MCANKNDYPTSRRYACTNITLQALNVEMFVLFRLFDFCIYTYYFIDCSCLKSMFLVRCVYALCVRTCVRMNARYLRACVRDGCACLWNVRGVNMWDDSICD